ncbi:AAA family ATPase [Streptomyces rochei]|uniref:AAA family ATPase n=1 Tax=Streptomyces rochei TaxID=1928 RepID=UPI0036BDFA18
MQGNATNVTRSAREPLIAAAKRHDMPPIAVMVATPGSVCIERQGPRPANRTVPEDVIVKQH